ncbi:MAG: hypothetical protein HYW91_00330 [Candidatus Sungbacteria bacterium]|nr:hypothetical protein [Candidatus Sungbacteria bacterium]
MIEAIQLFGTLILTVVGFVIPILTILVSIFPEGVKSLASKYENERKQSDENIANEAIKKKTVTGLDYGALEKTLQTLKGKKREAELKLRYLEPVQFLLRTAVPFIVAFIGVLVTLVVKDLLATTIALGASIVSFAAGVTALFTSISVLFEVAEIVNQKKTSNEEKIIGFLSILAKKPGEDPYLKEGEVKVEFNSRSLKKDEKFDFSVDKKYQIPIYIHNSSDRMAKTVEVGFVLPKDVVIEKTSNLEITTTEEEQIVRFKEGEIQAHNNNAQGNLEITFLKAKSIDVDVFIKGENVRYQRFPFKLNIVK